MIQYNAYVNYIPLNPTLQTPLSLQQQLPSKIHNRTFPNPTPQHPLYFYSPPSRLNPLQNHRPHNLQIHRSPRLIPTIRTQPFHSSSMIITLGVSTESFVLKP